MSGKRDLVWEVETNGKGREFKDEGPLEAGEGLCRWRGDSSTPFPRFGCGHDLACEPPVRNAGAHECQGKPKGWS